MLYWAGICFVIGRRQLNKMMNMLNQILTKQLLRYVVPFPLEIIVLSCNSRSATVMLYQLFVLFLCQKSCLTVMHCCCEISSCKSLTDQGRFSAVKIPQCPQIHLCLKLY